jgi:hypothetical protein
VDEIRGDQLGSEGGDYIRQEDDAFGDIRTDEVECCGEEDNVEDIIN